jgi:N-acetylglucosamine kinase-like BadF-type ATPase
VRRAELALGLDVGGTSSRALVRDREGAVLGRGEAGGGNPNSHPPKQAAREVERAAAAALADLDPARVRAAVLGMAGASTMGDPGVSAPFEAVWTRLGLGCRAQVVTDCEVAFAAGTPEPSGTVLIAGTGAVAARIEQHRLAATAGGHGWLLGDEGSAFWLGREAVRVALRALEGRAPRDDLTELVLRRLGADERKGVITAVNAAPPIRLAELAPLVTSAADGAVPTASELVRRAADHLAGTAAATRCDTDPSPIVLAGSLVEAGNPVGAALRTALAERSRVQPVTAGPGAGGAAWLAARALPDPA